MKRVEAVGILRSLVEGRDPATGEELPVEGVLQRAPVLRALLMAQAEMEESIQREKRRATLPERAGEPWTDEEDAQLMSGFQGGTTIADLATKHGRTTNAVEARLERLGLVTAHAFVRGRPQPSPSDEGGGTPSPSVVRGEGAPGVTGETSSEKNA